MTTASPKPEALPVQPDNIPLELRQLGQWVPWRYEYCPDKNKKKPWTKPLFQVNGHSGKSTDPKTWTTFRTVLSHLDRFDGIGFVVSADDPYTVIDLDNCRDPLDGSIEPWARDIIDRMDSYTEMSLSGTGIHFIAKGKLPSSGRKKGDFEIYDDARYLTITGHHLEGNPTGIHKRQAEIEAIHREWFGQKEDRTNAAPEDRGTDPAPATDSMVDINVTAPGDTWPDDYIIAQASQAKKGEKFSALWAGDWSSYLSQSEADQALPNILSFCTDRDPVRVKQLFRKPELYRAKWDEPHYSDGRTYGQGTIEKAGQGSGSYLSDHDNGHHPDSGGHHADHGLPRIMVNGRPMRHVTDDSMDALY